MERPYRLIYGVSYPKLLEGKRPEYASSNLSNPYDFYYDKSFQLSEKEINNFVGKPLCLEHDINDQIGIIASAHKDKNGAMRITGRVYTDTPYGKQLFEEITSGKRKCLSVNYGVDCSRSTRKTGEWNYKEISVVKEPFFEGAEILITASLNSTNQNYKNKSVPEEKKILFGLTMSDQVPPQKENDLLKHHDEILKRNEELQKQLEQRVKQDEEKQKRLDALENAEKQRREEYKKQQMPVLNELLSISEEQMKEMNGPEATLSQEYRQNMEHSVLLPEASHIVAPIIASARAWKKQRDEALLMKKQNEELQAKMKSFLETQDAQKAQIEASRRLHLASGIPAAAPEQTNQEVSITASRDMTKLFCPVAPSDAERRLYEMSYGPLPEGVNITAGAPKPFVGAPEHKFLEEVRGSMRFHNGGGKFLFPLLAKGDFDAVNVKASSSLIELDEKI